jgi:acyl carrier protein
MDISDRVKMCISKTFQIDLSLIQENQHIVNSFNTDSLLILLLQTEIEKEFDLDLSFLITADFNCTVSELITMVEYFINKSKE